MMMRLPGDRLDLIFSGTWHIPPAKKRHVCQYDWRVAILYTDIGCSQYRKRERNLMARDQREE